MSENLKAVKLLSLPGLAGAPVFPQLEILIGENGEPDGVIKTGGLTKFEYFANNAPDVPDWFECEDVGVMPKDPEYPSLDTHGNEIEYAMHYNTYQEAITNNIENLDEDKFNEVLEADKKIREHPKKMARFRKEQNAYQFFKWRMVYAENMCRCVAEREEK